MRYRSVKEFSEERDEKALGACAILVDFSYWVLKGAMEGLILTPMLVRGRVKSQPLRPLANLPA